LGFIFQKQYDMEKYIKYIYIVIGLLIISSCNQKDVRKPLLHEVTKVQAVMIDLYFADQALDKVKDSRKDSLRNLYRTQIETIHGVNLEEIETDIQTMQENPKWYFDVHLIVKDSIASLLSDINKTGPADKDRNQKIADEIKKAATEKKK